MSSSSSIEQTGAQLLPAAGPGLGDPDIAVVGALLADPSRCRVLLALDDGRALPAGRLAMEAGVSPATVSSHLRKLLEAGLLTVEVHGRCRYYRLAGPDVGRGFLDEFGVILPAGRPVVRYCVDWSEQRHHLAGALGRGLRDRLVDLDWVRPSPHSRAVAVTETGRDGLAQYFGVAERELR